MEKVLVPVIAVWYFYALVQSSVIKRSTLVCEENEMAVECAYCGPKSCEDLGYPIPCGGATGICRPECVCSDGLVRNADAKCIPKAECPDGCAGDKNATTGCGNHCGNTCSDYKDVNKTCFSGCRYNSCDCKPGFVYHEELKHCVLDSDCYSNSYNWRSYVVAAD